MKKPPTQHLEHIPYLEAVLFLPQIPLGSGGGLSFFRNLHPDGGSHTIPKVGAG